MAKCVPLVSVTVFLVDNTWILCVNNALDVVCSVIDLGQLFRLNGWLLLINPFFGSHLDHLSSIPY